MSSRRRGRHLARLRHRSPGRDHPREVRRGRAHRQEAVEAEAKLATESGYELLILDDGWQRGGHGGGYSGCGDWEPDTEKFPDFAAHVAEIHKAGLRSMAWIAPLLLGQDSAASEVLAEFAPHARPEWGCHVLDPRHARVREFAVDSCARLVETYGLDGLKIDRIRQPAACRRLSC